MIIKAANILNHSKAICKRLLPIFFVLFICFYSCDAFAQVQSGHFFAAAGQDGISLVPTTPACTHARMEQIYKSGCYACDIVTAIIGSFISACTYLYDVSKEAGVKILALGAMLWIAFYIFKQLASLKNIEPGVMVNELLIMAFKILGAYVVITAGVSFFINYTIVPFLGFGADFGIAMVEAVSNISNLDLDNIKLDSAYTFKDGILPASFFNTVQKYVKAVDTTVATHLEIGHLMTCYSRNAGSWGIIPNMWLWLAGAFIWFCGFMMTLSVAYYLVDMSFKLGFAIIALPITVALWPFNITKGKITACFSIILKAMGILIFLAMAVSIGLALVSASLSLQNSDQNQTTVATDTGQQSNNDNELATAIKNNNLEYISDQLSFFNFQWIIVLFAYLYAIKMIGAAINNYVNDFFSDKVFGKGSPMHTKLTQATDMAKKQVMKPVKLGGKIITHQTGRLITRGVTAAISKFKQNKKNKG